MYRRTYSRGTFNTFILIILLLCSLPETVRAQAGGRDRTQSDKDRDLNLELCPYYETYLESEALSPDSVGPSTAGDWNFIGPWRYVLGTEGHYGGLGRINTMTFHPTKSDVLYVGSAAGALWRTTKMGLDWTPLTDAFGVSGIAIPRQSPETIYVLTGDGNGAGGSAYYPETLGVLKSTDDGNSWTLLALPTPDNPSWVFVGYDLKVDPEKPDVLLAAMSWGLLRTEDGGTSWKVVSPEGSYWFHDIEYHPGDPSIVYATGGAFDLVPSSIWRSTNSGQSWENIYTVKTSTRIELAVTPKSPNLIYAVAGGGGDFIGFYQSENGGKDWTRKADEPGILGLNASGIGGQPWFDLAVVVSPANENEIWIGGKVIWKSDDGGVHWQQVTYWNQKVVAHLHQSIHVDIHDLDFHQGTLFAATDGGVYMKAKDHDRWADLSAGLEITQVYRICGRRDDADILYISAQDNGSNKLSKRTATQILANYEIGDAMVCLLDPKDPNVIYVTGQQGKVLKSDNGGSTFTSCTPLNAVVPSGTYMTPWITPFAMHPDDPKKIYGCYGQVWETSDGCASWDAIPQAHQAVHANHCVEVAIAGSPENYIYAAYQYGVYRRPLGEAGKWNGNLLSPSIVELLTGATVVSDLAINPRNRKEIWVTLSGHTDKEKIYKGTDGADGFSWQNVSGTLPNIAARTILFADDDKGGVYLGMDCGVYYRAKTMSDWMSFSKGLRGHMVTELLIQHDKGRGIDVIRAATFGWGMWESPVVSAGSSE